MKENNDIAEVVVKIDDSSNVIESLIFTRGQSYSDVYRFRFMVQLVKVAQETIRNNFEHVLNGERLASGDFKYAELVFPLRSVLFSEKDKNYAKAKQSLVRYSNWVLTEEVNDKFRVTPVLSFSELDSGNGTLRVEIRKNVWEKLLDFSKGYSEYNPEIILKITSPFGRQMYKGLRNQKGILSFSMENLKKTFGYADKYRDRDTDFIRKVVDKAKQELDKVADYSFVYDVVYGHEDGISVGRKKVVQVNFTSVRRVGNESDDAVRKMIHPAQVVSSDVYDILTKKLYFTCAEVRANIKLFDMAVTHLSAPVFADWLIKITPAACRAKLSTQGYVINSLKEYLNKKCGLRYGQRKGSQPEVSIVEEGTEPEVSSAFRDNITSLLLSSQDAVRRPALADPHLHTTGDLFGGMFSQ